MNLNKLYIKDFMCYEKAYIDFSQFNSALIVGKIDNNDSYSNGVGKTTIFKAIEYVLFNQSDLPLEKIIRDDTDFCKVTLDFTIDDQEYRLSRRRTKKGTTDLTLLQKNTVLDTEDKVYHIITNDGLFTPKDDLEHKYWKDISGRRSSDTEKDLESLIKINFKSFRSIVHFMQNDLSGLTTATPEKRKAILKDIFNIIVYSKLEKITKDRSNSIIKEIDKYKTIIESVGDLKSSFQDLNAQLLNVESSIKKNELLLKEPLSQLENELEVLNSLIAYHKELENKYSSFSIEKKNIENEISNIENSIKEYQNKKNLAIKTAKELIEENRIAQDSINKLKELDFSQIDLFNEQINKIKEKITYNNVLLQNNISKYEELKIPVPDDSKCKYCRQILTEEHKKECKLQILEEINLCKKNIASLKKNNELLNNEYILINEKNIILIKSKNTLDDLLNQSINRDREIKNHKKFYGEYNNLIEKFVTDLNNKKESLLKINEQLKASSLPEAEAYQIKITNQKDIIKNINAKIASLNKEGTHLNASQAVLSHNIKNNLKEQEKIDIIKSKLEKLEETYKMYPLVIQAFSSTGIPNLIIHNILEDLQNKTNELLNQLKPGLQLSFLVEKIKDDGSEADTLDIQYYVNGKERYYEQLSGAMKVSAMFSLKLGLSHLLQQIFGTNIRFILLDEIDQALDKAGIDAFTDIVRFFQENYKVLIITHNDRLKEKKSIFSHAICVEQDLEMVSRAKVVSSW